MADAIGIVVFGFIALIMFTGGAPLLIIGKWVEDYGEARKILAEARLLEARNAAASLARPNFDPYDARGREDEGGRHAE